MTDHARSDLRQLLQATLGSAFTLEHELTGGAMARVFTAHDATLARRIVVKVLLPELAEGVSAERFAREIRIAASLQQANIVPVLTTGETNGLPYYTMPFVEGLSLRERLKRDGALSIGDAVGVMRDVARALAFAHQQGVVHRDIKPENVLLSGDAAVVTDFGIAKAITVAQAGTPPDESRAATLTAVGMAIGTPAYMAPEQFSGDMDVDHRADIYAFGCLAYEIIAGTPPFQDHSARELFAAHLTRAPVPLTQARRDCPSAIADVVMRCLQKDPALRPQSAREVLGSLDTVSTPRAGDDLLRSAVRNPRAIGIAVAVVFLIAAAVFAINRASSESAAPRSLAVLPLANIGGDSAQEYLADGMTDELATAFGKMRGVRVASRSLAGRYRGQRDLDVRAVGRALDAAYVLQGTVRRVGDKLRVAAQLTNTGNGVEVWSDSYVRGADDVFAVQDDITRAVTHALGLNPQAASAPIRGTRDPEAYDLYLRGQYLLRRRGPAGIRQAADHFERAIARDGLFARAHAGLAAALELFPYFAATPAAAVFERATAAARRALELDSSIAEAHTALGMAYMHAYDWDRAAAEHQTAVELDPSDASAHHQYGRFLAYTAQNDSGLAEFRRAKAIDPYSSLYSAWIAAALWLQNRNGDALAEMRRAFELDSLNAVGLSFGSRMFLANGDLEAARSAARRLPDLSPWNGHAAYAFAKAGDREAAQRIMKSLRDRRPPGWLDETAIAYAALGLSDTATALAAFERATDRGEIWPMFDPITEMTFDIVRNGARFSALLKRVGLQEWLARAENR